MPSYQENQIVQSALEEYFENHHLGKDGGLTKKWAKIKVGPFYFPIPNTKARQKALVFHDIHHIVTGYDGNWKGEVSISAWEIASGCGEYYAAWLLDIWGMAVGLFIYPKAVYNGFIRGKRSLNLYHETFSREAAAQMQIGDLRKKLLLEENSKRKLTAKEFFSFISWAFIALASFIVPFVLPYIVLAWWLFSRH
jgi:hypothetical protein